MKNIKLTTEQKRDIIGFIIDTLKQQAFLLGKKFDDSIFFNLAFMDDKELLKFKKLCTI